MVGLNLYGSFLIKKIKFSLSFLIIFCLLIFSVASIVKSATNVNVDPSIKNVITEESFSVDIYCIPDEPIKAFEFKISFNASLLEAISVSEGDIFSGYPTFFNSGIINNSAGTIINVFGLIIGEGNVTDPGSLVTISYSSKSDIGNTTLDLYDIGITNETEYLSIVSNNGEVVVDYPDSSFIFSNVSPVNNSVDVPESTSTLRVLINNSNGNSFYWEIISSPDIGNSSGNNEFNGTKVCDISGLDFSTDYNWFVNCKDLVTSEWANVSFLFTTEDEPYSPPSNDGGGGFFIPNTDINNPPEKPLIPVGPSFIEKDIIYEYSSSSFDADEDTIRFKFDWGDGSFSNWSEYLLSDENVSMLHSWANISEYEIRVISQDVNGLNSSWSEPLKVVVSEINDTGDVPNAKISIVSSELISNETLVFDASSSFDLDGAIVEYLWDFGDGEFGDGINVSHIYKNPGEYIIQLTVQDNDGNIISDSMTVSIDASSIIGELSQAVVIETYNLETFVFIFVVMIVFIISFIIIFYRRSIELRLLNRRIGKIKRVMHNGKQKF